MNSTHDLLNTLKQLSVNANKAEDPMQVDYAEVLGVKPLKLDFGDFKVDESDELLILSSRIKELQEGEIELEYTCSYTGSTVKKKFKRSDKLKKGDCVCCIQEPGGESWVVLDRVEVTDD